MAATTRPKRRAATCTISPLTPANARSTWPAPAVSASSAAAPCQDGAGHLKRWMAKDPQRTVSSTAQTLTASQTAGKRLRRSCDSARDFQPKESPSASAELHKYGDSRHTSAARRYYHTCTIHATQHMLQRERAHHMLHNTHAQHSTCMCVVHMFTLHYKKARTKPL